MDKIRKLITLVYYGLILLSSKIYSVFEHCWNLLNFKDCVDILEEFFAFSIFVGLSHFSVFSTEDEDNLEKDRRYLKQPLI